MPLLFIVVTNDQENTLEVISYGADKKITNAVVDR